MTDLDDRLLPAVTVLISRVGISATYRQVVEPYFDPTTGEVSDSADDGSPAIYTVTATPLAPASVDLVNRGLAESHQSVTYLGGESLEFEPSVGDRITINDRLYRVTNYQRYESGASVCAWALVLEGGSS